MRYLKTKMVKQKIRAYEKQIEKTALLALDMKVDDFLTKICTVHNGSKKRITAELVNLFKM